MENWSALFEGQTRYFLDINDSSVKPDVLRFYGREALSEPFRWDIEFTMLQANIPPEEVLMKYASFRMRGGKNVHGMVTRWNGFPPQRTSLTTGLRSVRAWRSWDTPDSARYIRISPFLRWLSRCCVNTVWKVQILNSDWSIHTRRVKLSPSGGKRTLSLSGAFCLRWAFTGARRWTTCAVWIRTCRIFPKLYMTLNIRTPLPVTTTPATGHSPGKQHAVDEGLLGRGPVKLATNSLYLVSVGCAHRHFSS